MFTVIGCMRKENQQFSSTAITTSSLLIRLNLWESAPFEPEVRDNKLYARGASDDKGQVFMHIKAVEALMQKTGGLTGKREVSSLKVKKKSAVQILKSILRRIKTSLPQTSSSFPIQACKDLDNPQFATDFADFAAYKLMCKVRKATFTQAYMAVGFKTRFMRLPKLLASFRDKEGTIAVEGFYDNVRPL